MFCLASKEWHCSEVESITVSGLSCSATCSDPVVLQVEVRYVLLSELLRGGHEGSQGHCTARLKHKISVTTAYLKQEIVPPLMHIWNTCVTYAHLNHHLNYTDTVFADNKVHILKCVAIISSELELLKSGCKIYKWTHHFSPAASQSPN